METSLAPGFLIAAPSMRDPHFAGTVVLLAEINDQGALGFVLNRRLPFTFEELARETGLELPARHADEHVHYGGPVSPERGWLLFRDPGEGELDEDEVMHVASDIRLAATLSVLDRFLAAEFDSPFKLVMGYAGWGPSQLEQEIADGAWIPLELASEIVFDIPDEQAWAAALRRLGLVPGSFVMGSGGAEA